MAAQLADHTEETAAHPQAGAAAREAEAIPYGGFAGQMQALQAEQARQQAPGGTLMATPLLAQACADALIQYWQSGVERGAMDPGKPFYIVDLAPAQGQFAWLLLKALRARLGQRQRGWPICLLACCDSREAGAALLAHPYLGDFVEQGWLDAATMDAQHGGSLALQRAGVSLLQTDNPLALLGLGFFQTLPCELFGVHYGKLFEGMLAVTPEPADASPPTAPDQASRGAGRALRYQWTPAADGAVTPLLAYYRDHFHSAAILMPGMALKLLQRLQQIAGGRYLLMACDAGVCDEQAVRLGGLTPPERWYPGSAALPVNFHALSLIQRQHGAAVCNLAAGDDGMILHLACCDAGAEIDGDSFERICRGLEAAHPGHSAALRQLAAIGTNVASVSSAGMLAMLRQSAYEPAVLKLLCGAFSGLSSTLDDGARRAWQMALAASWDNFMPLQACDDFHVDCALLAMRLGCWGQAHDCLRTGLAFYGDEAHDLYLLAWCLSVTGANVAALACLQHAVALDPSHAGAQSLREQLDEKLARWRDYSWYRADHACDGDLCLEPLGLEHAQDILYQYRDDQIGVMTRLPELLDLEQTNAWIRDQTQEPGRINYAVMHAGWGLVGVVSCKCAEAAGYFYYWIGCDFQQRGYGQRAARLLFRQAMAHGVTEIYTSVEQVNHHSRHVLRKLGCRQLALRAAAPDDEQDFYYFGEEDDGARVLSRFHQLCTAIGCPVLAEEIWSA